MQSIVQGAVQGHGAKLRDFRERFCAEDAEEAPAVADGDVGRRTRGAAARGEGASTSMASTTAKAQGKGKDKGKAKQHGSNDEHKLSEDAARVAEMKDLLERMREVRRGERP